MSIRCYLLGHAESKYFESKKGKGKGKVRIRVCSRCVKTFSKTVIDDSGSIHTIEIYRNLLVNPVWSLQDTWSILYIYFTTYDKKLSIRADSAPMTLNSRGDSSWDCVPQRIEIVIRFATSFQRSFTRRDDTERMWVYQWESFSVLTVDTWRENWWCGPAIRFSCFPCLRLRCHRS